MCVGSLYSGGEKEMLSIWAGQQRPRKWAIDLERKRQNAKDVGYYFLFVDLAPYF